MEKTTRSAKQIHVHFFIFASIDLPLFLPKKVSLEPPSASIPEELLGCNKTRMIAVIADTAIRIIIAVSNTLRIVSWVGDLNDCANKFCK